MAFAVYPLAVRFHLNLLHDTGQQAQALVIGQHGHSGPVFKITLPDAQKPHQHRNILRKRRRAEMNIGAMRAFEHFRKSLKPDSATQQAG